MSTFQTEFGNGAKIIVPSIQRDYIQPAEQIYNLWIFRGIGKGIRER